MAKQPKPWTPGQERIGTLVTRVMSRVNTWMLRRSKGKFGKTLFIAGGAPVCLVTTTGVKWPYATELGRARSLVTV